MDLNNFGEEHAFTGMRHKTSNNMFWNGVEWQEYPKTFWDFNFSQNKFLIGVVLFFVGFGVVALITLN